MDQIKKKDGGATGPNPIEIAREKTFKSVQKKRRGRRKRTISRSRLRPAGWIPGRDRKKKVVIQVLSKKKEPARS